MGGGGRNIRQRRRQRPRRSLVVPAAGRRRHSKKPNFEFRTQTLFYPSKSVHVDGGVNGEVSFILRNILRNMINKI